MDASSRKQAAQAHRQGGAAEFVRHAAAKGAGGADGAGAPGEPGVERGGGGPPEKRGSLKI